MAKALRGDRTIETSRLRTADLAETNQKLVFWKQVLPEMRVPHTDERRTAHVMNFDRDYQRGLHGFVALSEGTAA